MKLSIELSAQNYDFLTWLARESLTSPSKWASEAVENALAEKRKVRVKFYRPAGEKVLK